VGKHIKEHIDLVELLKARWPQIPSQNLCRIVCSTKQQGVATPYCQRSKVSRNPWKTSLCGVVPLLTI